MEVIKETVITVSEISGEQGCFFFFFFFFFWGGGGNSVYMSISSSYETGQSVGSAKTGEPASRLTWFVSHVPRVGLEPTPDGTAVR